MLLGTAANLILHLGLSGGCLFLVVWLWSRWMPYFLAQIPAGRLEEIRAVFRTRGPFEKIYDLALANALSLATLLPLRRFRYLGPECGALIKKHQALLHLVVMNCLMPLGLVYFYWALGEAAAEDEASDTFTRVSALAFSVRRLINPAWSAHETWFFIGACLAVPFYLPFVRRHLTWRWDARQDRWVRRRF